MRNWLQIEHKSWWRHSMKTLSPLLVLSYRMIPLTKGQQLRWWMLLLICTSCWKTVWSLVIGTPCHSYCVQVIASQHCFYMSTVNKQILTNTSSRAPSCGKCLIELHEKKFVETKEVNIDWRWDLFEPFSAKASNQSSIPQLIIRFLILTITLLLEGKLLLTIRHDIYVHSWETCIMHVCYFDVLNISANIPTVVQ